MMARPDVPSRFHRRCRVCDRVGRIGTDFHIKVVNGKARQVLTRCKACESAASKEYLRARREAKRLAKAALDQAERDRLALRRRGVFEASLAHLEAQWRKPFAEWTRAQHEAHSRFLRAQAGVPEDQHTVRAA